MDEERKRRAFRNALSNLGLLAMSEEEKPESTPDETSITGKA